jgi:hypothetical protein
MTPSDPDFPYDIEALECSLMVPQTYPHTGKPSLRALNKDIPRGFQINIERGFDTICSASPEATLLGLMNRLDKQLEVILAGEMAETVKVVVHKGPPSRVIGAAKPGPEAVVAPVTPASPPKPAVVAKPKPPVFTSQQKEEAKARRQANTRQLEARLGRLSSFAKSADGFSYTIPLDSPKRSTWPADIQPLRSFTLLLPELYPLEPSTIMLDSESSAARNVEKPLKVALLLARILHSCSRSTI